MVVPPSSHPFIAGIFHEINHPANLGYLQWVRKIQKGHDEFPDSAGRSNDFPERSMY